MDAKNWILTIQAAKKTCIVQDGLRKVHYTFSNGSEMTEDYDEKTFLLLERKWKQKSTLGGDGKWEYEVGENLLKGSTNDIICESSNTPICIRRDTQKEFQWRIRNLPYPLEVYSVTVDDSKLSFTVRTSNKKYFKKLDIPDLLRLQVPLEQNHLSFGHANNTLIISYRKPPAYFSYETLVLTELKKSKAVKDDELECNPS